MADRRSSSTWPSSRFRSSTVWPPRSWAPDLSGKKGAGGATCCPDCSSRAAKRVRRSLPASSGRCGTCRSWPCSPTSGAAFRSSPIFRSIRSALSGCRSCVADRRRQPRPVHLAARAGECRGRDCLRQARLGEPLVRRSGDGSLCHRAGLTAVLLIAVRGRTSVGRFERVDVRAR